MNLRQEGDAGSNRTVTLLEDLRGSRLSQIICTVIATGTEGDGGRANCQLQMARALMPGTGWSLHDEASFAQLAGRERFTLRRPVSTITSMLPTEASARGSTGITGNSNGRTQIEGERRGQETGGEVIGDGGREGRSTRMRRNGNATAGRGCGRRPPLRPKSHCGIGS